MPSDAESRAPDGARDLVGDQDVNYRIIRENVTRLLEGRRDAAALAVPACPGWTVYDTVKHLVTTCRLAERNLVGRPRRRARDGLPQLLAEWVRSGARVEQGLRKASGGAGAVLVMDGYTHEADIRHALALPPQAAHPALRAALELAVDGFRAAVLARGYPALRLETASEAWDVGDGVPKAVLFGPGHELYRSLVGRRTLQQIRDLSWTADPTVWLPAFSWGPFRPPLAPVE
ncbi:maleylpyruvate isomerase family mycothiol-dependent enzyme [Streptomyces sp. NPDC019224]|uniref:maleylpyruvate isomerase family mycothiol-dependent enzyme n=1 Tax=Streptomyces sp. NPDC019224 TaxID=3154484 RepID=UPI00340BB5F6